MFQGSIRAVVARALPQLIVVAGALLSSPALPAQDQTDPFTPWLPEARWRVGKSVVAPWVREGEKSSNSAALSGQTLQFSATVVQGPHPLGCRGLNHEFVLSPAEGLFQGALPEPAEVYAQRLGFVRLPAISLRLNCDTGSFDYHLLTPRHALLGLDNRVWRLRREDRANAPEDFVLAFLHAHMSADGAFSEKTVARKSKFLTPGLTRAIRIYFAQPKSTDEVPAIDGDPFTNSQEYPQRFVLGRARLVKGKAVVPVRFGEEGRGQLIRFELRRVATRWRLDDLFYEEGGSFRGLLSRAGR